MGMIGNAPVAGTIGTGNIQDGGVETADIKDGAVVNAKLGSDLDASKLTAGTLPIDRVADGAVTAAKLASTAVTDKLGYTPVNKAGDTLTGKVSLSTSTVTGGVFALNNGSTDSGTGRDYQMEFGFHSGAGYRHYLRTRHDSTVGSTDNAIDFLISDGTAGGTLSTAIRGLTISNAGTLMPKNPGFRATGNADTGGMSTQGTGADQSDLGQFITVVSSGFGRYNNGGFNTSTGVFTAPVAGYYLTYANVRWETQQFTQNSYIRLFIDVNNTSSGFRTGIHAINGMNEAWADYMAQNVSGVVYLGKGDTLRLRGGMNGGGSVIYHGESSWGAHLIG